MDAAQSKIGTSIQITALDAIVNVNSLYTLAVFLGLAWNPYDRSNTLVTDPDCFANAAIAENLISFHVYSFSSFLFSSLLALCLKQVIRLSARRVPRSNHPGNHDNHDNHDNGIHFRHFQAHLSEIRPYVNKTLLRLVLLVTAVGSASGCVFLMLALVNVVQVKLGTLACGSSYSYGAVVPLLIFVPVGLLVYTGLVLYAFSR